MRGGRHRPLLRPSPEPSSSLSHPEEEAAEEEEDEEDEALEEVEAVVCRGGWTGGRGSVESKGMEVCICSISYVCVRVT